MTTWMKLMGLAAVVLACSNGSATDTTQTTSASVASTADNTAINQRDKHEIFATPMDQGNTFADVRAAAAIRRALVVDKTLSSDAKNVKIIVNGEYVILRGAVKTTSEKALVGQRAAMTTGIMNVANELDVEQQGQ